MELGEEIMANRYVEITLTPRAAERAKEIWAPQITSRFKRDGEYVKLRLGPFNVTRQEEEELQLVLDILPGLLFVKIGLRMEEVSFSWRNKDE
jgi:hypothetical protein